MESTMLSWSDSKHWTSRLPVHNEMRYTLKNVGCFFLHFVQSFLNLKSNWQVVIICEEK